MTVITKDFVAMIWYAIVMMIMHRWLELLLDVITNVKVS